MLRNDVVVLILIEDCSAWLPSRYGTGASIEKDRQGWLKVHELSVANSILTTVMDEMKSNGYKTCSVIGLRIGEMTDISEASLRFGFEALTKGTILENVKVTIENVPLQGKCEQCRREFRIVEFKFVCPDCQGVEIEVVSGKELDIIYLEVEPDA